jgi:hypothetical protein
MTDTAPQPELDPEDAKGGAENAGEHPDEPEVEEEDHPDAPSAA